MPPGIAAAAWGLVPVLSSMTFIRISRCGAPCTRLLFLSGHGVDLLEVASAVILKGLNEFYSHGNKK